MGTGWPDGRVGELGVAAPSWGQTGRKSWKTNKSTGSSKRARVSGVRERSKTRTRARDADLGWELAKRATNAALASHEGWLLIAAAETSRRCPKKFQTKGGDRLMAIGIYASCCY